MTWDYLWQQICDWLEAPPPIGLWTYINDILLIVWAVCFVIVVVLHLRFQYIKWPRTKCLKEKQDDR
jgi:hypothetical protein